MQMMKPVMAVLLTIIAGASVKAQSKRPHILIGANIYYANPQGSFSNAYNFGLGGELSGGVGLGKTFLVASYGSSIYFANNKNNLGNITTKPVKVGLKQYFLANKIFVIGDVGIASVKDKTMNTRSSQFARGIGAGVRLLGLEGGLYYDGFKSVHTSGYSNSLLLKVGWNKML